MSPPERRRRSPPPGFEWSRVKARLNERKHAVTFLEATTAFSDPASITIFDEQHSVREDRWLLIGCSSSGRLLVVLHAERGANIRIIGARDAEAHEKADYEEGEERRG